MKKIKGGKRVGSGRKKTGRKTEVVSFSIPKEMVKEIKDMVKERLAKRFIDVVLGEKAQEMKKATQDILDYGYAVTESKESSVRRVDQNSKEGLLVAKIAAYEEELKTLPDIGLGKKRRIFVEGQISNLKRQLK